MDVGINLKNQGPYIIKVQKDKGLPILYLTQLDFDKKSNVRIGPKDKILHFNGKELLHIVKYLTINRPDIKNISIINKE